MRQSAPARGSVFYFGFVPQAVFIAESWNSVKGDACLAHTHTTLRLPQRMHEVKFCICFRGCRSWWSQGVGSVPALTYYRSFREAEISIWSPLPLLTTAMKIRGQVTLTSRTIPSSVSPGTFITNIKYFFANTFTHNLPEEYKIRRCYRPFNPLVSPLHGLVTVLIPGVTCAARLHKTGFSTVRVHTFHQSNCELQILRLPHYKSVVNAESSLPIYKLTFVKWRRWKTHNIPVLLHRFKRVSNFRTNT